MELRRADNQTEASVNISLLAILLSTYLFAYLAARLPAYPAARLAACLSGEALGSSCELN